MNHGPSVIGMPRCGRMLCWQDFYDKIRSILWQAHNKEATLDHISYCPGRCSYSLMIIILIFYHCWHWPTFWILTKIVATCTRSNIIIQIDVLTHWELRHYSLWSLLNGTSKPNKSHHKTWPVLHSECRLVIGCFIDKIFITRCKTVTSTK